MVAEECAAAGYGTAARRAAIFKAMAEEFPSPKTSGRLNVDLKGKRPRQAQAEFEDLLSHPFEWIVMAYMYRMNINDLGDVSSHAICLLLVISRALLRDCV